MQAWFDNLKAEFELNFIQGNRWKFLVDGLKNTLTITFFALLIGIAIASSSAMVLPISTPPNALAFSTNLVNQKDMSRMGIIVGIISMVMGYALLYLIGKAHLL